MKTSNQLKMFGMAFSMYMISNIVYAGAGAFINACIYVNSTVSATNPIEITFTSKVKGEMDAHGKKKGVMKMTKSGTKCKYMGYVEDAGDDNSSWTLAYETKATAGSPLTFNHQGSVETYWNDDLFDDENTITLINHVKGALMCTTNKRCGKNDTNDDGKPIFNFPDGSPGKVYIFFQPELNN